MDIKSISISIYITETNQIARRIHIESVDGNCYDQDLCNISSANCHVKIPAALLNLGLSNSSLLVAGLDEQYDKTIYNFEQYLICSQDSEQQKDASVNTKSFSKI